MKRADCNNITTGWLLCRRDECVLNGENLVVG